MLGKELANIVANADRRLNCPVDSQDMILIVDQRMSLNVSGSQSVSLGSKHQYCEPSAM